MQVPPELAALPQWVIWRYEKRKEKVTKAPYRARDGKRAATTRSDDWSTLEEALAGQEAHGAAGIGFVFSADDPYCGIDIDDCFNEAGEIHPEAEQLVNYVNSYTEYSPSGNGLHLIVKGEIGTQRRRTANTPWGGFFEAYDAERYFTFTGKVYNRRRRIRERALDIQLLEDAENASTAGSDDDNEHWLAKARRNEKFVQLYDDGDWSEYDSQSEADLALCNLLLEYAGPRPRIVKRAFMQSALYRPDKSGGLDYIERTVERAFSDSDVEDGSPGFEKAVNKELQRLKVRDEAKRRHRKAQLPEGLELPVKEGDRPLTLADELALPDLDDIYRIEKLHPIGGNVLLVAAYKSGKTTLTLNLLRALADGTPFLGRYDLAPMEGNIAVFNYEERPEQWRRHVRKLGIQNPDRVFPVHRRGKPILPLWEDDAQNELVQWMIDREIAYWIMDPTVVAWQGLVDNENDNALAAAFTTALDQVKERAGIGELILTHHTGRFEETRGRGATRLEDWADAMWYLERDEKTEIRSMWARGRDVEVERFHLEFDDYTFTAGESMSEEAKAERVASDKELKRAITELLQEKGEMTQTHLKQELGAAGMPVGNDRLKAKLDEWTAVKLTPGIGSKQGPHRSRVLFWRKKED